MGEKMEVNNFLSNTSHHYICRLQSIRDLLLLGGVNLSYEELFLLSTTTNAVAFQLTLGQTEMPVYVPGDIDRELQTLRVLGIPPVLFASDLNGYNIKREIKNGHAVLCYYSHEHMNSVRRKPSIAPMSTCVAYAYCENDDSFITNLDSANFACVQKVSKFVNALNAQMYPTSPRDISFFIDSDKINIIELKETLPQKLRSAVLGCCENVCSVQCWNEYLGCRYLDGNGAYALLINAMEKFEDSLFDLSQREAVLFFHVYMKILFRFICYEVTGENNVLGRLNYISAVKECFGHIYGSKIDTWCSEYMRQRFLWENLFDTIKSASRFQSNSTDHMKYTAYELRELFESMKGIEHRMFTQLAEIII